MKFIIKKVLFSESHEKTKKKVLKSFQSGMFALEMFISY